MAMKEVMAEPVRIRICSRRVRRLRALTLVGAVGTALALSACGGGGDDETTGDAGVKAVSAPGCGGVEYGGEGQADALIVSDLPLLGDSKERSAQMNDAIRDVLDEAGWKAGNTSVAFQVCDDSIAKTGLWDEARCRQNAQAYAADADVIGVIGTYNSGCAEIEVPILNRAPGGGLAMVSPGNTLICLTEPASGCEPGQPDSLYPSGTRNYARVIPNDAYQGAGLATFAKNRGLRKVYILYAGGDPTSLGQARTFRGAAGPLGIEIAGFQSWDTGAKSYTDLMQAAKKTQPDAVLLAGLIEQHGADLIKDKVAVLGPNSGQVKLLAPDGFAQQSTIDQAGADTKGMYASLPGKVPSSLTGEGSAFVKELKSQIGDEPLELFAPYAGQAAEVLLAAVQAGNANRAGTIASLFKTKVTNGIVGSFSITPSGDPSPAPISVSEAADTFKLAETITPPSNLITAARGG
jgi:branched-chain amino acid transport system substrate-binding protein